MKNKLVNKVDDLVDFVLASKTVRRNPGLIDICLFAKKAARFLQNEETKKAMTSNSKLTGSTMLTKELNELLAYNFEDFFDEEEYFASDEDDSFADGFEDSDGY